MILKVIALGLITEKHTYLRHGWNILDIFIVLVSLLEIVISNSDIASLKVLRLLRILRPLRFISHNINMKIVVNSLFSSLKGIFNVGVIIAIIWLMFAILGVALFGGKFYSCENNEISTEEKCDEFGYKWENSDTNFDNVPEAMLTLFVISTLEGWPDIMYKAIDSTELGHGPEKNNNPVYAYYFIVFIAIASFFSMNLVIGVVFESYQNAKNKEVFVKISLLNPEQRKWFEMMKLISASSHTIHLSNIPKNKFRLFFYKLCTHKFFDTVIMACIILNMIQMAIIYVDASSGYIIALERINLILTMVFILEAMIKLVGLGTVSYFHNGWNKFDFFVVVTSLSEIILTFFSASDVSLLRTGPQLARIFRVLRLTKLFRYIHALRDIELLINTLKYSIGSMLNVASILLLIFFIYAILGVFLFNEVHSGNIINEHVNFYNFGNAMIILFIVATGEDWNLIMFDCTRTSSAAAYIYFISFQVISGYIMLNLFVMVLLQGLEDNADKSYNLIDQYTIIVKDFNTVWKRYTAIHRGFRMHNTLLVDFMYDLGSDLGIHPDAPRVEVVKQLSSMNPPTDEGGYIYYNDMLFCVLKRSTAKFRLLNASRRQMKILLTQENETLRKNQELIEKTKKKHSFCLIPQSELISDTILESNPFSIYCTMRKVFKEWKEYVKNKKEGAVSNDSSEDLDLEYI